MTPDSMTTPEVTPVAPEGTPYVPALLISYEEAQASQSAVLAPLVGYEEAEAAQEPAPEEEAAY